LKTFVSGKAAVATISGLLFSPDSCADMTAKAQAAREKAAVNRLPKSIFTDSSQVLSKGNEERRQEFRVEA